MLQDTRTEIWQALLSGQDSPDEEDGDCEDSPVLRSVPDSLVSGTHPRDRRATSLSISIKHISVIWRGWQRTSPPCGMTEADCQ